MSVIMVFLNAEIVSFSRAQRSIASVVRQAEYTRRYIAAYHATPKWDGIALSEILSGTELRVQTAVW